MSLIQKLSPGGASSKNYTKNYPKKKIQKRKKRNKLYCSLFLFLEPTTNICDLPNEVGLCKGYFPRYYFDKVAGECKIFIYGGCGGNANNFETLVACQTTCPENCQLSKVTGPCYAYIPRYYFDKKTGKGKKFIYGGCRGNVNNFKTLAACQKTCQDPQTCLLPEEPGLCKERIPRYYFDKVAGKCKKFIYGGCDGNSNNFATKGACNKKCLN